MDRFLNLPTPIKGGVVVGGVGGILTAGFLVGAGKWIFLLVLLFLLLFLVGGYLLMGYFKRRKQNAQLTGELGGHSRVSPQGISDPGQRARLDDLRKKFEVGIHEYRSRGKDLYTLPWYILVGEPGSGKTEAVRHSSIGFPPGMQDEFQGVGGTINMSWWFTNQGVILDTAGRLMFEEVAPGGTSEWKEFLSLLKKNRPNCPINGLFLVIPSDSLIRDSADVIGQKAGKIARQLDLIQRTLDIRFPVYVIVTKCDKINGFREFFDDLTDPTMQFQIMGWTNPDPLDSPFRPDLVDEHLTTVASRLRKRRMGLMRDPVPAEAPRRANEVDSLYALPHSLSLLAPRLRSYLQTIFVAGEWSAKPLFLRGIFFTSSMREGAALDEELANAIGVSVDELPEGKNWERERAYFLRDLFVEKVFRERGLVTRATNTSQMLRRRQVTFLATLAVGLVLFLGIAFVGMLMFKGSVADQSGFWQSIARAKWTEDSNSESVWNQSIIPLEVNGLYASYTTNKIWLEGDDFESESPDLGTFYAQLNEKADKTVEGQSWLFPSLTQRYRDNKERARRIIFETGVLKPAVDAARQRLRRDSIGPSNRVDQVQKVVAWMIHLESQIQAKKATISDETNSPSALDAAQSQASLQLLLDYASYGKAEVPEPLVKSMVSAYRTSESGESWPPQWVSDLQETSTNANAGASLDSALPSYPSLQAALSKLLEFTSNSVKRAIEDWNKLKEFRATLEAFRVEEKKLHSAADGQDMMNELPRAKFLLQLTNMYRVITDLNPLVSQVKQTQFYKSSNSFASALTSLDRQLRSTISSHLGQVRATNDLAISQNADSRLFQSIRGTLSQFEAEQLKQAEGLQVVADSEFDRYFFASPDFGQRAETYSRIYSNLNANPYASKELLGEKGQTYQQFMVNFNPAIPMTTLRDGESQGSVLVDISATAAELAVIVHQQRYIEAYMKKARDKVYEQCRFPLVKEENIVTTMDFSMIKDLNQVLNEIQEDLKSADVLKNESAQKNSDWIEFTNRLNKTIELQETLVDRNGNPLKCEIYLRNYDDKDGDKWRDTYHRIKLNEGQLYSTAYNQEEKDTILGGGGMSVNNILSIHVFKDEQDEAPISFSKGSWGPIRLLHECVAKRSENDHKEWAVSWQPSELQNPNLRGEQAIRLLLRFDEVLPELNEWPTRPKDELETR